MAMDGKKLSDEEILALERPEPGLMTYYVLNSFFAGPFFFVPLALLYFRYHTLRYRFDQSAEEILPAGSPFLRWVPWGWIELIESLAFVGFVVQAVYSLLLVLLDYRYRWYVVTDRSLRIREGIWKVQERTMTFSNVQNVTVRQGPLQCAFGIADMRVQTAGGGGKMGKGGEQGATDQLHIGYFRGVANAPEIRDAVLARLRRLRDSGLGDPEESERLEAAAEARRDPPLLEAAREVLGQTRELARELARELRR